MSDPIRFRFEFEVDSPDDIQPLLRKAAEFMKLVGQNPRDAWVTTKGENGKWFDRDGDREFAIQGIVGERLLDSIAIKPEIEARDWVDRFPNAYRLLSRVKAGEWEHVPV